MAVACPQPCIACLWAVRLLQHAAWVGLPMCAHTETGLSRAVQGTACQEAAAVAQASGKAMH